MTRSSRADYGLDAPNVVRNLGIAGATCLLGAMALIVAHSPHVRWARPLLGSGLSTGATALVMWWSSRFGKLRLRERLLARHQWRGDEQVLDAGCGRGLMMIGAAKRLSTGRVLGVDLWRSVDQAGNDPEATLRNAIAEGVAERIELHTGDVRQLPLGDASCDVVTSTFVLHNIHDSAGRAAALREMVRIAKPGGQILLADIGHGREYAAVLRDAGADARVQFAGLYFLMPTFVVTATRRSAPHNS